MPEVGSDIPLRARLLLSHAATQMVANRSGSDVLHIKGEALDPEVRWLNRLSTDVDVLVRPAHVGRFLAALMASGWHQESGFAAGSAFEHSATLSHEFWGYLDVHRIYPGLDKSPEDAFERLWSGRGTWVGAGVRCAVPDLAAQRLVLLLHAGRSSPSDRSDRDVAIAWTDLPPELQTEVRDLAERTEAQVGLAAATGGLDAWVDDPRHDLWQVLSEGGTRIDEWRARIKAAGSRRAKLRLVLRAPLVNVEHLTIVRGARPTRGEIVVEFFARPARGVRQEWRRRRQRSR